MISNDTVNVISTSWGQCEPILTADARGFMQDENTLFQEAATQGQSIFAAAGDTGSEGCDRALVVVPRWPSRIRRASLSSPA